MAGTAYHMEALRKARVIERKTEAMRRLQEGVGQDGGLSDPSAYNTSTTPLVFSEQGHYEQKREFDIYPPPQTDHKKFVRREKDTMRRNPTPESVKRIPRDQVYSILHPLKLNYYRVGRERDRRQYDHSRDGPVVDRTRHVLKQEFNFLGSNLSMMNANIQPMHKPMPVCRR